MADREREAIRQQLEEELRPVTFTGHDRVLRQTHPLSLRARLSAFWNKELEIPLGTLGAAAALLVTGALLFYAPRIETKEQQTVQMPRQRELIEAGGNTYWKDIYEQAVKQHEN
jgi:type VI protein secretion system component VasF